MEGAAGRSYDQGMCTNAPIFSREKLQPVSHSFLEPRGEGILFAVMCVLASLIIYSGVLLIRFLG